jgi:hypothetical protein
MEFHTLDPDPTAQPLTGILITIYTVHSAINGPRFIF